MLAQQISHFPNGAPHHERCELIDEASLFSHADKHIGWDRCTGLVSPSKQGLGTHSSIRSAFQDWLINQAKRRRASSNCAVQLVTEADRSQIKKSAKETEAETRKGSHRRVSDLGR